MRFQVLTYENEKSFLEFRILVFGDVVSAGDELKDLRTFLFAKLNDPLDPKYLFRQSLDSVEKPISTQRFMKIDFYAGEGVMPMRDMEPLSLLNPVPETAMIVDVASDGTVQE